MVRIIRLFAASLTLSTAGVSVVGCSGGAASERNEARDEAVGSNSESFDDFERSVEREPETGVYIVNDDQTIEDIKLLKERYEKRRQSGALVVDARGGRIRKWSSEDKLGLTYCVSTAFGSRTEEVIDAMRSATAEWESVADVKFVYAYTENDDCTRANTRVLFDVSPAPQGVKYFARAFFPGDSRKSREVLVGNRTFTSSERTLVGTLRHELGHVLGFRHEHIRPESGASEDEGCAEDGDFEPLTPYDKNSLMHYPQCNGTEQSKAREMTQTDAEGAAILYGGPSESSLYNPTPISLYPLEGTVDDNELEELNSIDVEPGTSFNLAMTGEGDPDVYVRFDGPPTQDTFDCRPFLTGASEECRLTVPEGQTKAFLAVRGYKKGSYQLSIAYTKPSQTPSAP